MSLDVTRGTEVDYEVLPPPCNVQKQQPLSVWFIEVEYLSKVRYITDLFPGEG